MLPAKATLAILWLQPRVEQTGTKVKALTKILDVRVFNVDHSRSLSNQIIYDSWLLSLPFFFPF